MGDWWITELSQDGSKGFGYTRLNSMPECAELGYIWVKEIQDSVDELFIRQHKLKALVERDLHWTPITLGEILKANPNY